MKEFSIEEKARRYDEAIKKVNDYYEGKTKLYSDVDKTLDYLFPALKESEDEKVRKAIIEFFELQDDNTTYSFIPKKDILAWLEKQGEQNPTDNVEPKFHVGEWIVHQGAGNIYQVAAVIDNQYQLKGSDTYTTNKRCADVDRNARLWHITKDAKDGDVLASGDVIFIFNKIHGECVKCHFSLYKDKSFIINSDLMTIKTYPATKEQRDALMKAMADAGYEWDATTKELKRIEQEYHCNGVRDPKEATGVLKQLLNKENYAWSEEDEAYRVDILVKLEPHITDDNFTDVQNWFKSIKDRVQPQSKQEWSEEDKVKINRTVAFLENLNLENLKVAGNDILLKDIEWLKSLKDRYAWRPSEEQM